MHLQVTGQHEVASGRAFYLVFSASVLLYYPVTHVALYIYAEKHLCDRGCSTQSCCVHLCKCNLLAVLPKHVRHVSVFHQWWQSCHGGFG